MLVKRTGYAWYRFVKSCDKCASFRIAYPRLLVLLGLGTHLEKRLTRNNRDINPLDAACCEHNISIHIITISRKDTWPWIYSPWKRGNALSRDSTRGEICCYSRLGG